MCHAPLIRMCCWAGDVAATRMDNAYCCFASRSVPWCVLLSVSVCHAGDINGAMFAVTAMQGAPYYMGLAAVDLKTGMQLWWTMLPFTAAAPFSTPVVSEDGGVVYITGTYQTTSASVLLALSAATGGVVDKLVLNGNPPGGGTSDPAVAGGTVYIGDALTVYAVAFNSTNNLQIQWKLSVGYLMSRFAPILTSIEGNMLLLTYNVVGTCLAIDRTTGSSMWAYEVLNKAITFCVATPDSPTVAAGVNGVGVVMLDAVWGYVLATSAYPFTPQQPLAGGPVLSVAMSGAVTLFTTTYAFPVYTSVGTVYAWDITSVSANFTPLWSVGIGGPMAIAGSTDSTLLVNAFNTIIAIQVPS